MLFHNPNALHPLPREWFGAALEDELVGGERICTFAEPFLPYASITQIFENVPLALVHAGPHAYLSFPRVTLTQVCRHSESMQTMAVT